MSINRQYHYKIGLLPQASILQKIERHSQGAAEDIMVRAEKLQAEKFAQDEKDLQRSRNKGMISSLFHRLAEKVKSPSPSVTPSAPTGSFLEDSFGEVGNYMRQAMRGYIMDNKIDFNALGLTPTEKFDLTITDNSYIKNPVQEAPPVWTPPKP